MRANLRIVRRLHPDNTNEFDDDSLDQRPSDLIQSKQIIMADKGCRNSGVQVLYRASI